MLRAFGDSSWSSVIYLKNKMMNCQGGGGLTASVTHLNTQYNNIKEEIEK